MVPPSGMASPRCLMGIHRRISGPGGHHPMQTKNSSSRSGVPVYHATMPKVICIQLHGYQGAIAPHPLRIPADKVEPQGDWTILKLGEESIGQFRTDMISGWWIEGETGPSPGSPAR
jgi:hypothetical protein